MNEMRTFDQVVKAEHTKERLAVHHLSLWAVVIWPVVVAGAGMGSIGGALAWVVGSYTWAGAALLGGAAMLAALAWRLNVYDRLIVLVDTRVEFDQISRPQQPAERFVAADGGAMSWTIWKITQVGATYLARYAQAGQAITRDGCIRAANLEFRARFGVDIIPRYSENWRRGTIQEQFEAAGWVLDRERMIPTQQFLALGSPPSPMVTNRRGFGSQTTTTTTATTALFLFCGWNLGQWVEAALEILGAVGLAVGLLLLFFAVVGYVWGKEPFKEPEPEPDELKPVRAFVFLPGMEKLDSLLPPLDMPDVLELKKLEKGAMDV